METNALGRLLPLFLIPLCVLCLSCGTGPQSERFRDDAIATLRTFGDAAMRLEGTRLLTEHAPTLVPLLDRPTPIEGGAPLPPDGQVSLDEAITFVRGADAAQVAQIALVVALARKR